MIVDQLANAALYRPLGPGIAAALDYLAGTNFSRVEPGRYDLEEEHVFALVQRYQPKALADAVWESHRRFVDVQYVAAGVERMGYASLAAAPAVRQGYDESRDVLFYQPGRNLIEMRAGHFAIFGPHDVHAPGLAPETPQGEVLKVVVKVAVQRAFATA